MSDSADSFNFLPSSLEKFVQLLLKGGKEKFKNTTKYLGDSQYVFRKGVFSETISQMTFTSEVIIF